MSDLCRNITSCGNADKKEYCGVFGIFEHDDAVDLSYLGLYALQHRGEESCGIAVNTSSGIKSVSGMGLVADVLKRARVKTLQGRTAIGHVRYSTTGSSIIRNAQPFVINHHDSSFAIAHNGNLTNAVSLRKDLEKRGAIFQTTMDSELVLHLMVRSRSADHVERLTEALRSCEGAFTMLVMTEEFMVGVRDPYGFRPLSLGRKGRSYVLASESCSFDLIGAKFIRDIEPGEAVIISSGNNLSSVRFADKIPKARCIFEFIYFSRPDSDIFGESVYKVRKRLGLQLAEESPAPGAELVTAIPDSGNYAALGYSQRSKIPFEFGMVRNHYVGRTFIQPSQEMRSYGVKIKLNPVKNALKGKSIVVVEDSIVRGTTTSGRIKALREAGVKEIHMRISCPPVRHPCYYGIDFPSEKELIANLRPSVRDIADFIGVDTLRYLSHEGMLKAVSSDGRGFCTACFNGVYPSPVTTPCCKNVFDRE